MKLRDMAVLAAAAAILGGCVARTAYHVGTAPIRATSKAVDWTTTSRSEADRNRGRQMRKACEKARKDAKRGGPSAAPVPTYCG
jgi:hypothetical protein